MIKSNDMCVIIDANVLGKFLSEPEDEDCDPIYQWLRKGGKIVYSSGGQFGHEIGASARGKLSELASKGNAIFIGAQEFQDIEASVKTDGLCRSDDFHILALAKFTRARVLYTKDQKLIHDFKNKDLIDKPRGRIYTSKSNKDLLNRSVCRMQ